MYFYTIYILISCYNINIFIYIINQNLDTSTKNKTRIALFRALTVQDSIIESETINYILFMVFCWCDSNLLKKEVEKIRLQVLFRL